MNYFELLKEIDKSLEKHIKNLESTGYFKKYIVSGHLRSALVHVKRELRKEV